MSALDEPVEVAFVNETDVTAFPDDRPEYCVLPVRRVPALLLTPTCNLKEDYWLFAPLRAVAAHSAIQSKVLHSTTSGYADLFGIYAYPGGTFEESFVSFHDTFHVPSEPFRIFLTSRVANLSKEASNLLEDKFARFLSRGWGYAPHEKVEQDGFYRCRNCSKYYGLENNTVYLIAETHPPKCQNCVAVKKTGSWELLMKHKRSKNLEKTPPPRSLFTRALKLLKLTK